MRRHIWQYLLSTTGEPISGARIHVFDSSAISLSQLNGSVVAGILDTAPNDAYIYVGLSRSTAITTFNTTDILEITTDAKGFFEFWVIDTEESSVKGYDNDLKIVIFWTKTGYDNGYVRDIDVFGIEYEVDETDNISTTKNKQLSNSLAYGWQTHISLTSSGGDFPHDIEPADVSALPSESTYSTLNKLVSNELVIDWNALSTVVATISGGYLAADGTVELSGDWDIGAAQKILLDTLRARDATGISFQDDGGNVALLLKDGGEIEIDLINIDGGTADNLLIGSTLPSAGTFTEVTTTDLTADNLDVDTGTVDFLTSLRVDSNVTDTAYLTAGEAIIESGELDSVDIGVTTPGQGHFTTVSSTTSASIHGEVDIDSFELNLVSSETSASSGTIKVYGTLDDSRLKYNDSDNNTRIITYKHEGDILLWSLASSESSATSGTASSGSSGYYADVTHNLNVLYPIVFLYDKDTNKSLTKTIETLNTTDVRVWTTDNSEELRVIVIG